VFAGARITEGRTIPTIAFSGIIGKVKLTWLVAPFSPGAGLEAQEQPGAADGASLYNSAFRASRALPVQLDEELARMEQASVQQASFGGGSEIPTRPWWQFWG
jgi:hypothetical protein